MIRLDREDTDTFLMVKNTFNGSWNGSFDIRSTPVTIEPGASFIPRNGRIIIGE